MNINTVVVVVVWICEQTPRTLISSVSSNKPPPCLRFITSQEAWERRFERALAILPGAKLFTLGTKSGEYQRTLFRNNQNVAYPGWSKGTYPDLSTPVDSFIFDQISTALGQKG
jgi:hypothetical protein